MPGDLNLFSFFWGFYGLQGASESWFERENIHLSNLFEKANKDKALLKHRLIITWRETKFANLESRA